jgi:hypothetical protein
MHNLLFFVHRLLSLVNRKDLWRALVAASAVAAFVLAGAAWVGAEEEVLPNRFMLRLGGYHVQNADAIMRLDMNNLPVGTYIDFHNTLGGETSANVFRMDGLYRFNDNNSLWFSWYALRFAGTRVLDREIKWGDHTFPIYAKVDSELKYDIYKLNYEYSLYHNDKIELAVSAGLHVMRIFAGITENSIGQSQTEAVTAPLPVFGLGVVYNFTPRFNGFFHYQWFFINYQDKVKGGLQDFLIGLEYRVFRNVALGAAYNRFALNVEAKRDATTLYVDANWNGGMLYGALYY